MKIVNIIQCVKAMKKKETNSFFFGILNFFCYIYYRGNGIMKKNVYIIIVIVLLVVILLSGTVFFIKYYKDKSHEADIKSENIIVEKDNYKLKISYPTFGDNKFNIKIANRNELGIGSLHFLLFVQEM